MGTYNSNDAKQASQRELARKKERAMLHRSIFIMSAHLMIWSTTITTYLICVCDSFESFRRRKIVSTANAKRGDDVVLMSV